MKIRLKLVLAGCIALSALAVATGFAATIAVDEDGHSVVTGVPGVVSLPFALKPDPGPGGLGSTLTYTLPFTTVIGDVTFVSASDPGVFFGGDVIRFNGETLVFYSDSLAGDPSESLADTPGPPGALYANVATAEEIGTEGSNHAFYTPLLGEPGFHLFADGTTVSYVFFSDGPIVPVSEPRSALLMATGIGSLCIFGFLKTGPARRPSALGCALARRSERA